MELEAKVTRATRSDPAPCPPSPPAALVIEGMRHIMWQGEKKYGGTCVPTLPAPDCSHLTPSIVLPAFYHRERRSSA